MNLVARLRAAFSRSVTHDYRYDERGWGHDLAVTPDGLNLRATGWGPRAGGPMRVGDFVLLSNGPGQETRYRIVSISYYLNVRDMWRADMVFAPRPAPG